jgi:hypothetical protein
MKVEIPVRWAETVTDPDALEEIKTRRIIYGDEEAETTSNTTYSYDFMVIDMDDVKLFHRYDDEHFILKLHDGEAYCVHLGYEGFKEVYEDMMNTRIVSLRPMPTLSLDHTEEEN